MQALITRRPARLLAVLLAAALAVTACAGGDGTEQPAGASAPGQVLERQTVSSDDVEIAVSGRLTSSSAVFDVELTRHDGGGGSGWMMREAVDTC